MSIERQRGITFMGFLGAVIVVVAAGLLVMKMAPVYINHYEIVKSIGALDKLPKAELKRSPPEAIAYLKEHLSRQLYLNEIRFITKKQISVTRAKKVYKVSVPYVIEKKLFGHVFLVFRFHPHDEIPIE